MSKATHNHDEMTHTVKIVDEETGEEFWVCADCLEEMIKKGEVEDSRESRMLVKKLRKLDEETLTYVK